MIGLGELTMAINSKQTNRPAQAAHQQPPKIADHVAVLACAEVSTEASGRGTENCSKEPQEQKPQRGKVLCRGEGGGCVARATQTPWI